MAVASASNETPAAPGGRWAAYAAGLAGVAGLGVSAYFAVRAHSRLDESNRTGDPRYCDQADLCGPEGLRLRRQALHNGNVATASTLIGLALVGTGAILYFRDHARSDDAGASIGLGLGPGVARIDLRKEF
jgi:hypothetical protein